MPRLSRNVAVGSYPNPSDAGRPRARGVCRAMVAEVSGSAASFPSISPRVADVKEWANLPYVNYGCATQKMLAAQVDDPRDFARARALTEPDVEMRLRAIDDVRKGQDPGTTWKVQNTAIGQVGGS